MGFLEDLLDMTVELESPRSYWYWSGLAAVSAVSKHLKLSRGGAYDLYPNIYVLLVGKSAIRKGPPINLAKKLVSMCDVTRVISGRSTIQSILDILSKAKACKNGEILTDASGFIVSGEQSNSITDDPQSQTILTELYDTGYNDKWVNSTLSGGITELKNPCITVLGATAPEHIPEYIQARSVKGGYIGRTMIVFEDRRSRLNSLTKIPEIVLQPEKLVKWLLRIGKLKGEFTLTPEGAAAYDAWYYPYNEAIERGEMDDETGTAGRLGDHVFKIAMLLSLASRDDLLIKPDDIQDAISACTNFTVSVRRISAQTKGKTDIGVKMSMVFNVLLKFEGEFVPRSKVLQRTYPDVDAYELDRVIETLKASKWIEIAEEQGKEISYRMKKQIIDHFKAKGKK